jgi:hypothetical protein
MSVVLPEEWLEEDGAGAGVDQGTEIPWTVSHPSRIRPRGCTKETKVLQMESDPGASGVKA